MTAEAFQHGVMSFSNGKRECRCSAEPGNRLKRYTICSTFPAVLLCAVGISAKDLRPRRQHHFHPAAGTKRNQALRLDGMPRHQSQPVALRDGGEQERRFGRGEGCSNADTTPAAEG